MHTSAESVIAFLMYRSREMKCTHSVEDARHHYLWHAAATCSIGNSRLIEFIYPIVQLLWCSRPPALFRTQTTSYDMRKTGGGGAKMILCRRKVRALSANWGQEICRQLGCKFQLYWKRERGMAQNRCLHTDEIALRWLQELVTFRNSCSIIYTRFLSVKGKLSFKLSTCQNKLDLL